MSASPQTQALCALLYLYREVLGRQVGELEGLIRAKRPRRLPVLLTREEVRRVAHAGGTERLFLMLLYETGLRLMEGLRLRVKDVDFAENQITVRDGKGAKDRVTMLPAGPSEREDDAIYTHVLNRGGRECGALWSCCAVMDKRGCLSWPVELRSLPREMPQAVAVSALSGTTLRSHIGP